MLKAQSPMGFRTFYGLQTASGCCDILFPLTLCKHFNLSKTGLFMVLAANTIDGRGPKMKCADSYSY